MIRRSAVVLLAVLALTGCAGHPAAKPTPTTVTVNGTLSLAGGNWISENGDPGEVCTSMDGYDDIADGAEVDVTDSTGKVLALGRLSEGTVSDDGAGCVFPWSVDGVPTKGAIYGVQVTHRGIVHYSKAELLAGPELTLGG